MRYLKKSIAALSAVACIASAATGASAAPMPFDDVAPDRWYTDSIRYVYDRGMMQGTGLSSFEPELAMSRAMMVTVLHRQAGCPEPESVHPFVDVPEKSWYGKALTWAWEQRIVRGTDDVHFSPNQRITREEIVSVLYRYAANRGGYVGNRESLDRFGDRSEISDFARDAFRWAVADGLIAGTGNDMLSPADPATRAQCAEILSRYGAWSDAGERPDEPQPPETQIPGTEPNETVPGETELVLPSEPEGSTEPSEPEKPLFPIETEQEPRNRAIAAAVAESINDLRIRDGQKPLQVLPGMTLVAEYRADQLTLDCSHNYDDYLEAHTHYRYGIFCDMGELGQSPEDSYYSSGAREAIQWGFNYPGEPENIAREIAQAFYESEGHWAYLGSSEQNYIAVGVECKGAELFCCVLVNSVSYDQPA